MTHHVLTVVKKELMQCHNIQCELFLCKRWNNSNGNDAIYHVDFDNGNSTATAYDANNCDVDLCSTSYDRETDSNYLFHDDNNKNKINEEIDEMNDICLIEHDYFNSYLTMCMDPDLPCKVDNKGFIKEINGTINFANKLFKSTHSGKRSIQVQEKAMKKD